VNGKTVLSCVTKVGNLDGAEVITVEGLGTPDNPHLIQEAFVLSGAVQCGFCISGMIMATKALLDKNPDPDTEEIKKALRGNLCRCTGYVKIIDAVKLAARFLRGETTPEQVRPEPSKGSSALAPQAFGRIKACGVASSAPTSSRGALELAAVRSPHAHALILSIDTSVASRCGRRGGDDRQRHQGTNRNGDRWSNAQNVPPRGGTVAAVCPEREPALKAAKK
jgi:aldehyde oxidoreductase